jgi:hypothetical protein
MAISKSPQVLRSELAELEHEKTAFEQELAGLDPDSQSSLLIRGKVAELESAIYTIEKELDRASTAEEKIAKKASWEKIAPVVDRAIVDNYMGYIIPEAKFIYCKDYGVHQNNIQFTLVPATQIVRVLNKMIGHTIKGKEYHEIIDYFESKQRSYFTVTSSFNNNKWNETQIYNKMTVAKDQWLKPDFERSEAYDPRFDLLMYSVTGGKAENIDHLEQWIGFKYLNPHKNANIPNIDIGGTPGGNGKGSIATLLTTIFTPICVIQAHREELEKFNANWEMAAVLYYDEPDEKDLAAGKLKQATGGEAMRIEKKGIDATMADRNYNFLFFSNNHNGVVKLSGGSNGGEDRRYSVISTNIVLKELFIQAGQSEMEAMDSLNDLQQLIKNGPEVAKWLAHIINKHNIKSMTEMPALHGQDYQARFENQKDVLTEAFDKIVPIFIKNECIPTFILTNLVQILTENTMHKTVNLIPKFLHYLSRNKIDGESLKRQHVDIMWQTTNMESWQGDIIKLLDPSKKKAKFDYSDVSTVRWKSKLGTKNTIDADTIQIA